MTLKLHHFSIANRSIVIFQILLDLLPASKVIGYISYSPDVVTRFPKASPTKRGETEVTLVGTLAGILALGTNTNAAPEGGGTFLLVAVGRDLAVGDAGDGRGTGAMIPLQSNPRVWLAAVRSCLRTIRPLQGGLADVIAGLGARKCGPKHATARECVRMPFFCVGVDVALM
jgi:hypothetical protein